MGVVQMGRLPGFLETRARNYRALADGLRGIDGLRVLESDSDGHLEASHYCLSAMLADDLRPHRTAIIDRLKAGGVGTSVYYPKSVPDTTFYRSRYGFAHGSCPVATSISEGSIAFPVAPHVTESDVDLIIETVKENLHP
jgi:dTDP-4-amino-4,6-dideoxygalactose transaminase